jgi:lauroyl/myristoyl acyltransferase
VSRQAASGAQLDARDLRSGGRWTAGQGLKNALIRLLIRTLLGIADRLPPAWMISLCGAAGRAARRVTPRARRIAEKNLA